MQQSLKIKCFVAGYAMPTSKYFYLKTLTYSRNSAQRKFIQCCICLVLSYHTVTLILTMWTKALPKEEQNYILYVPRLSNKERKIFMILGFRFRVWE